MKQFDLKRVTYSTRGTFGVLVDSQTLFPIALTLEKPWRDNEREVSCIPGGLYLCKLQDNGEKISVFNVPNRDGIQIETFNYEHQSKGCIALGQALMRENGVVVGVSSSKEAFNILLDAVGKNEFVLKVQ